MATIAERKKQLEARLAEVRRLIGFRPKRAKATITATATITDRMPAAMTTARPRRSSHS